MPRLVTKKAHCLVVVFDRPGILGFDALEPMVGKVEWNADDRRSIRTPPFVAQVDGRTIRDASRIELIVETPSQDLDTSPTDRKAKVGDARPDERCALTFPLRAFHSHPWGQ